MHMGWADKIIGRVLPSTWHKPLAVWLHFQKVAQLQAKRNKTETDRQRLDFYRRRLQEWGAY